MLDVRETDPLQGSGAASVVLEVHIPESLGGDLPQPLLRGPLLLSVEKTSSIAVAHVRGSDRDGQEQVETVRDHVPLAAGHLLAAVVTACGSAH